MKRYGGILVFLFLLLIIIPSFSLLGGGLDPLPDDDTPAIVPTAEQITPPTLENLRLSAPQAYQDNRFYLVENHLTGELMALSPEDYLIGVVAAEMPASYHSEALKAQAVAAHSYALRQIGELDGAHLSTDPEHFQAYLSPSERQAAWGDNASLYENKISSAVSEVLDQVMVSDGEPIAAAFHAISSGRTEDAANVWGQSIPYLEPVESPGDLLSPDYESQIFFPEAEVANTLLDAFPGLRLSEDRSLWFTELQKSDSGRVLSLTVGDQQTSGQVLRELFQLPSAAFTVEPQSDGFQFTCYGRGHGVGMSQYGADYLARQGYSWRDILTYYYKNVIFVYTAQ